MRRLLALLLAVVLTGCGGSVSVGTKRPDRLDGATIASKANAQLEKENPTIAHGDLTCDDVAFKVGSTARCLRTVSIKDGRLVKIGATVTIDRVTRGGHFNIQVDDQAQEFGLTGASVFADLAKQYAAKYGGKAPTGSCPSYLRGEKGNSFACTLETPDGKLPIVVTVTSVDPKDYATGYTFKAQR